MHHMRTRTLLLALLTLSILPLSAISADIDGKWKGKVQTGADPNTRADIYFTFTFDGKKITGTSSSFEGQGTISQGKINEKDGEISFTVDSQRMAPSTAQDTYKYKGKINGNEMKLAREWIPPVGSCQESCKFNGSPFGFSGGRGGGRGAGSCSDCRQFPPFHQELVLTRVESPSGQAVPSP
jgi:hypothetical protein